MTLPVSHCFSLFQSPRLSLHGGASYSKIIFRFGIVGVFCIQYMCCSMFLLVDFTCFSLCLSSSVPQVVTTRGEFSASNTCVAQCFLLLSLPVSLSHSSSPGCRYTGVRAIQKSFSNSNSGQNFASDTCVAQGFPCHMLHDSLVPCLKTGQCRESSQNTHGAYMVGKLSARRFQWCHRNFILGPPSLAVKQSVFWKECQFELPGGRQDGPV